MSATEKTVGLHHGASNHDIGHVACMCGSDDSSGNVCGWQQIGISEPYHNEIRLFTGSDTSSPIINAACFATINCGKGKQIARVECRQRFQVSFHETSRSCTNQLLVDQCGAHRAERVAGGGGFDVQAQTRTKPCCDHAVSGRLSKTRHERFDR